MYRSEIKSFLTQQKGLLMRSLQQQGWSPVLVPEGMASASHQYPASWKADRWVTVKIAEYHTGSYFYLTNSLFYIENDMNIIHCMALWICRYLVGICLIKAVNNFVDFRTFTASESCFEHSFRP